MTRRAVIAGALLALWQIACGEASSPPAATPDAATDPADAAIADAAELADATVADAAEPADATEAEPVALVHSALWSVAASNEDPFAPPAPERCPAGSFGEEVLGGELVFYVSTELCPSLTVRQSTRVDVASGDTLRVRLFHFPLTAPEPASARLMLQLGDDEVVREEIPIPSEQAQLTREWVAERDYQRGTPIWFHVENHGFNEYVLTGVERLRAP